jgi:hypothetical protein
MEAIAPSQQACLREIAWLICGANPRRYSIPAAPRLPPASGAGDAKAGGVASDGDSCSEAGKHLSHAPNATDDAFPYTAEYT